MPIDNPINDLSKAHLLAGLSLAFRVLVDEINKIDGSAHERIAEKIDNIITHLSEPQNQNILEVAQPLLLLRRSLDAKRPYEAVEAIVRSAEKQKDS